MPDRIPPGFQDADVIIRSTREHILADPGARTANGNGASQIVGDFAEGILAIDITAVSGATASATFKLQTKINGQWRDIPGVTIAAQTAQGAVTVPVTNFGEEIRLAWTLTGTTPIFTFSAAFLAKT